MEREVLLFEAHIKLGSCNFCSSPLAADSEAKRYFWDIALYRLCPAFALAPQELRQGKEMPSLGGAVGQERRGGQVLLQRRAGRAHALVCFSSGWCP